MWIPREEWIKTLPRTIVASCVVMLDRDGRVLLLRYGPGRPAAGQWWLPGGMLDHGEDPWAAARREMSEETGAELDEVPRLIGTDHRADVENTGPVIDYFFHGGVYTGEQPIRLSPEHDLHAFRHLDELQDTPLGARLQTLTALHTAARSGTAVYLREGSPLRP
ncbi:NUDIX hydrolase [Streptomyces sp. NBC_00320]|uniref:NUDIX hydrolase n=1 Tax=Streptomyces sp. NBC_00320 TaxID=2975711 RepID=UPI000A8048DD|nr:NUDIX hydrolase [Streptomyces sp. NBC_00320]MCX5149558.1 NUDIX hydrolase [Streptomyces sp. NBC_00320]